MANSYKNTANAVHSHANSNEKYGENYNAIYYNRGTSVCLVYLFIFIHSFIHIRLMSYDRTHSIRDVQYQSRALH